MFIDIVVVYVHQPIYGRQKWISLLTELANIFLIARAINIAPLRGWR